MSFFHRQEKTFIFHSLSDSGQNQSFFFFSYVVGIPGISMLAYGITGAGQLGRDTALFFSRRERRTSYRLGWSGKIFSNGWQKDLAYQKRTRSNGRHKQDQSKPYYRWKRINFSLIWIGMERIRTPSENKWTRCPHLNILDAFPTVKEFKVKKRVSLSRYWHRLDHRNCQKLDLNSKLYPSPACLGNYSYFTGYWENGKALTLPDELPLQID